MIIYYILILLLKHSSSFIFFLIKMCGYALDISFYFIILKLVEQFFHGSPVSPYCFPLSSVPIYYSCTVVKSIIKLKTCFHSRKLFIKKMILLKMCQLNFKLITKSITVKWIINYSCNKLFATSSFRKFIIVTWLHWLNKLHQLQRIQSSILLY